MQVKQINIDCALINQSLVKYNLIAGTYKLRSHPAGFGVHNTNKKEYILILNTPEPGRSYTNVVAAFPKQNFDEKAET
jgi:hypothetical protein